MCSRDVACAGAALFVDESGQGLDPFGGLLGSRLSGTWGDQPVDDDGGVTRGVGSRCTFSLDSELRRAAFVGGVFDRHRTYRDHCPTNGVAFLAFDDPRVYEVPFTDVGRWRYA